MCKGSNRGGYVLIGLIVASYPATLLPDPVDHMFAEVVHGPADYRSDYVRNFGHKSLRRREKEMLQTLVRSL